MNDLLALATLRRMLLEVGYDWAAEQAPGSLEIWAWQGRPELDGNSPMEMLVGADGEALVRACLAQLLPR